LILEKFQIISPLRCLLLILQPLVELLLDQSVVFAVVLVPFLDLGHVVVESSDFVVAPVYKVAVAAVSRFKGRKSPGRHFAARSSALLFDDWVAQPYLAVPFPSEGIGLVILLGAHFLVLVLLMI